MLNSAFMDMVRMAFAGKFHITRPRSHLHRLNLMRIFTFELSSY